MINTCLKLLLLLGAFSVHAQVYTDEVQVINGLGGKVGIGISVPTSALQVNGTVDAVEFLSHNDSPIMKLENSKTSLLEGDIIGEVQFYQHDLSSGGTGVAGSIKSISRTRPDNGNFFGNVARLGFFIGNSNSSLGSPIEVLTISQPGRVGVGVTNPAYPLHVNGQVRATAFISNTTSYADFVFEDTYKLMPLAELETYIQKYHHLPEIPTEKEAMEKGINLAEMNVKLLQKVEELTLHLIEHEKAIKTLKNELDEIKSTHR